MPSYVQVAVPEEHVKAVYRFLVALDQKSEAAAVTVAEQADVSMRAYTPDIIRDAHSENAP